MKKLQFTGKLTSYERLENSEYGNPKYFGVFENENGDTLKAITATDASCAYSFLNNQHEIRTLEYHKTKAENYIIDYNTF